MRLKLNVNFRLLFESLCLSFFVVGGVSAVAYLIHLLLSVLFASTAVFTSLFGLAVVLGVLCSYDAEMFQWDNHPRIAIKRFTEEDNDDDQE